MGQRLRRWAIPALIILGLLLIASRTARRDEARAAHGFVAGEYRDAAGHLLRYRLLVPPDYSPRRQYPLLVFLHGSLEAGDDNVRQLKPILPFVRRTHLERTHPCFVLVPQCPPHTGWVRRESYRGTVTQSPQPTMPMRLTLALIPRLEHRWRIDPGRVYLLGVSSGGAGVWDAVARRPQLFAAAVPFSGSGDPAQASRLAETPIWAFHGKDDPVVNRRTTELMVRAVRAAGGHPRLTEYPGVIHSVWLLAYRDPAFTAWLFAQHRTPAHH